MTGYFLVKSEPNSYSFADLQRDGKTRWDGVRSFEARNNLRAMKKGDLVLFYHSNEGKEVVGVARVVKEAYADPSAGAEESSGAGAPRATEWSAVDLEPVTSLGRAVGLAEIKTDAALADILLLRRSRLSVVPVSAPHFKRILALGKTKL